MRLSSFVFKIRFIDIDTINALTAADFAIIPTQADIMNLKGIESIHKSIELVRTYCNKNLKVRGILLTRFNDRTILNRQMLEKIKETAAKLK
jgi:chromosome partitioning protein